MNYIPEIFKIQKDGINYYDTNWLNIEADTNYKDALMDCMSYCKPDMYFNLLYRFIIKFSFEDQSKPIPNAERLERLYIGAALRILKEQCSLSLTGDDGNYSLEWTTHLEKFSNHLDGYLKTILYYIIEKSKIQEALNLKESDNPMQHENSIIFAQNVMASSFFIAYNRIHSEKESQDFLGAEIIPFGDREILNIYLTSYGMANLPQMESWDKDLIFSYFNGFVKKLGFNRIDDKERLEELNTSVLLEKDNKIYYHFRPPNYDYTTEFLMKKLKKHYINSIKLETQVSFEQKI